MVRVKSPSMLFIEETKRSEKRVDNLRWRLALKHCASMMDSVGQGGGLVLFWHESMEVNVLEKNQRFIDDVEVRESGDEPWF